MCIRDRLVGGGVGTLTGGPLADRFGRRAVLLASMVCAPGLILAFLAAGPAVGAFVAFLIGAVTVSTFAVTVVMGQELLPDRIGLASGVTLGFGIGMGGVGAVLLGLVADRLGLVRTFDVIAALPVLGLAFTLTLPRRPPLRTSVQGTSP